MPELDAYFWSWDKDVGYLVRFAGPNAEVHRDLYVADFASVRQPLSNDDAQALILVDGYQYIPRPSTNPEHRAFWFNPAVSLTTADDDFDIP